MFESFKKQEQKTEPVLLGEDFEMYPDVTGIAKKPAAKPVEESAQTAKVAAEPEKKVQTDFQKKVEEISEEKWNKYQMLGGIALGLVTAFCITYLSSTQTFGTVGFAIAIIVALLLPNLFERWSGRSIPKVRKWLAITLMACLVVVLGIRLLTDPASLGIGVAA